jgi:hypothetical protein
LEEPLEYEQVPPEELRKMYVKATLRQRYGVAIQRIDNPGLGPSLLVNVVSALEGFSRAVAMRGLVTDGVPLEQAYKRLKHLGAVDLLVDHVCPKYRVAPRDAFGSGAWDQLPEAVEFRNLLIHEATYLNGGTSKRLIAASRHTLDTLAALSGAA